MHWFAWKLRIGCGLTLLSLTGCYSYYPYGYGPAGSYPGVYNAPPAGPAVSPGPVLGPPSTFSPQGSAVPQYRQSNGSGLPAGVTPAYAPGNTGSNPVPEYNDPAGYDGGSNDLKLNEDDASSPFGYRQGTGPVSETVASASAAGESAGAFLQPVPAATGGDVRLVAGTESDANPEPSPFDHDSQHYRWLRGVVDYDAGDGSWNIIYDARPDPEDQFGGSITLVSDGRLSQLRDNDVVLVQGQVDPQLRDQFGKPRYRIDELSRLVPK